MDGMPYYKLKIVDDTIKSRLLVNSFANFHGVRTSSLSWDLVKTCVGNTGTLIVLAEDERSPFNPLSFFTTVTYSLSFFRWAAVL